MFYYISGRLTFSTLNMAVLEAGGVGYKLTVSENTYRALPPPRFHEDAPTVTLFTHMAVREDNIELYGFISEKELSAFKMLLSVSGVGPKAAMAVLSFLTPEKFALAVCTEDRKALSKAPGIGPKTAARIILELKDKLMKEQSLDEELSAAVLDHGDEQAGTLSKGKITEAQDALMVLGYSRAEAQNALKGLNLEALSLEEIIRESLKKMMKP